MRIPRPLIVLAVAAFTAVAGCGGDAETAPPATSEVTLISAGTDPRPLRLRLEAGDVYRAQMTMRIQLQQTIDGTDMSLPRQPGQRVTIEATTSAVSDGTATLTFRYPAARLVDTEDVDENLLDQLESFMRSVTGLRGTLRMTDRGVVLDGGLEGIDRLPAAIRPTMEQLTDQLKTLSIPLPEEPVGIGGSWQGRFSVDLAGLRTDTTYTYTLRGRDGDRLDIDAEAVSTVAPGESAGAVPGVDIVAAEGGSRTRGSIVADLSSLFPVSSAMRLDGTVTMRVNADGRASTVVARTSGTVELDPGDG